MGLILEGFVGFWGEIGKGGVCVRWLEVLGGGGGCWFLGWVFGGSNKVDWGYRWRVEDFKCIGGCWMGWRGEGLGGLGVKWLGRMVGGWKVGGVV